MTTILPMPRKRDPAKRIRQPSKPPGQRSREAQGMASMAASGLHFKSVRIAHRFNTRRANSAADV